jgi:serine/threonine-protein kinase
VVEVSWHDAVAYAAWRSAREGREVRLPSEAEWEKAARGVDGRAFPWGQHFDATWCNSGASRREGGGRRGPVGEFPVDESPYGVRDLAGNVLDWCQNLLREDQDWRAVRGGRFTYSGLFCRVAHRFGEVPGNPGDEIGFRVVAVPRRSAP